MRKAFKKGFGLTLGIGAGLLTIKILRGLFHVVIGHDDENDISEDSIEIEL